MNKGGWGGGLMNSTMLFAQETYSAPCQFELQGERSEIITGSCIWAGNEWAAYGSLLAVIGNCYNVQAALLGVSLTELQDTFLKEPPFWFILNLQRNSGHCHYLAWNEITAQCTETYCWVWIMWVGAVIPVQVVHVWLCWYPRPHIQAEKWNTRFCVRILIFKL